MERKFNRKAVFTMAWEMVKKLGYTMAEALRTAWANAKFRACASKGIVEFYFRKVDGTTRQAFGTICGDLVPPTSGTDNRKKNDLIQTYFDTEKSEWRCFKKFNLLKVC